MDLSEAKDRMHGSPTGDVLQQIRQDFAFERGLTLQLPLLDSIYSSEINHRLNYSLVLYDKTKKPIDIAGIQDTLSADFSSGLYPIGTHGYQYIQVKLSIPLSPFVKKRSMDTFTLHRIHADRMYRYSFSILNHQKENQSA